MRSTVIKQFINFVSAVLRKKHDRAPLPASREDKSGNNKSIKERELPGSPAFDYREQSSSRHEVASLLATDEQTKPYIDSDINTTTSSNVTTVTDLSVIDKQDIDGYTLLMRSAHAGEINRVRELLTVGANPDVQNHQGATALILAIRERHCEVVELLVRAGADVSIRTGLGLDAFDVAIKKDLPEVLHILSKSNHNLKSATAHNSGNFEPNQGVVARFRGLNPSERANNTTPLVQLIKNRTPTETRLKFDGFYHMTDFENASSIIKEGKLYCRSRDAMNVDMARYLPTTRSVLNNTGLGVKNYARLYFRPLTPTYFHFEKSGRRVVVLKFNQRLLGHPEAMISIGNAGKTKSRLMPVSTMTVEQIDFGLLYMDKGIPWSDHEKNVRNTELLIPRYVGLQYLDEVLFKSESDHRIYEQTFGLNQNVKYRVDQSVFFSEEHYNVL